jgi:hypothetical protein
MLGGGRAGGRSTVGLVEDEEGGGALHQDQEAGDVVDGVQQAEEEGLGEGGREGGRGARLLWMRTRRHGR